MNCDAQLINPSMWEQTLPADQETGISGIILLRLSSAKSGMNAQFSSRGRCTARSLYKWLTFVMTCNINICEVSPFSRCIRTFTTLLGVSKKLERRISTQHLNDKLGSGNVDFCSWQICVGLG